MGEKSMDRRTFLGAMGAVGTLAAAGGVASTLPQHAVAADAEFPAMPAGKPVEALIDRKTGEVKVNDDVLVRYSACLGCYSSCGNRMKLDRASGQLISVGGNPYHPSCALPYLNNGESLTEAYKTFGFTGMGKTNATLCGRGQATFDGYNQPDRVTVPLKRAGKRGEGKWTAISWDTLIKEVTEGGKLFAGIGEDREVEGFKAIHDTKTPLNPEQPDLGPKSNQFVMFGGRGDGRTVFGSRFANCFGSINQYGHGST